MFNNSFPKNSIHVIAESISAIFSMERVNPIAGILQISKQSVTALNFSAHLINFAFPLYLNQFTTSLVPKNSSASSSFQVVSTKRKTLR